jgi:hypothetical protein
MANLKPKLMRFFVAVFMAMFATAAIAEEPQFEGEWVVGQAVSAGISSERGCETAEPIEGRTVSIAGFQLALPDGVTCLIGASTSDVWRNDMEHFGSGGGNWSDIGLSPDGRDGYPVELRTLDCGASGPHNLVLQIGTSLVLIEFDGRVFVPLLRPASS